MQMFHCHCNGMTGQRRRTFSHNMSGNKTTSKTTPQQLSTNMVKNFQIRP
jgi:hypothetical protein